LEATADQNFRSASGLSSVSTIILTLLDASVAVVSQNVL